MPDGADDLVRLEQRDGVAVVTLNDPAHRNVFSSRLVHALAAAMERAERDDATRCIVVTGAGSAFCAGAEVATLRGAAVGEFDDVETVYQGFLRVRDCPLPTIAAVNGPAVGAGFNLALACDVRLAGPGRGRHALHGLEAAPGRWPRLDAGPRGRPAASHARLPFGEVWDAQAAVDAGPSREAGPGGPGGRGRRARPAPGAPGEGVRAAIRDHAPVRAVHPDARGRASGRDHGAAVVRRAPGLPRGRSGH